MESVNPQSIGSSSGLETTATGVPVEMLEKPDALATALAELNELRRHKERADSLLLKAGKEIDRLNAYILKQEENPLWMLMATLDAGDVLREAGDELKHVVATVRRLESKGTFTLNIVVKPFKGDALTFHPEVKSKVPKDTPSPGVYYANEDGALSRSDRRQPELPLGKPAGLSRGDRSAEDEAAPYADEKTEAGSKRLEASYSQVLLETTDEELRVAQALVDEMNHFPTVHDLQRKLRWGYAQASRVHEALRAVTR